MSGNAEPVLELVIVRHGQSEGNRDRSFTGHGPSRLTALGQAQAEATAVALAQVAIDHIYASDLVRCAATAAPLAQRTGLPAVETSLLRERNMGDFTGLTFDEVRVRWPDDWESMLSRRRDYRPPGGESHDETRARVGRFLDEVRARHPAGRAVLFSHGVAINHMLRHLLGMEVEGTDAWFQIDNCSLQRLACYSTAGAVRVVAINDTAHLRSLDAADLGEPSR